MEGRGGGGSTGVGSATKPLPIFIYTRAGVDNVLSCYNSRTRATQNVRPPQPAFAGIKLIFSRARERAEERASSHAPHQKTPYHGGGDSARCQTNEIKLSPYALPNGRPNITAASRMHLLKRMRRQRLRCRRHRRRRSLNISAQKRRKCAEHELSPLSKTVEREADVVYNTHKTNIICTRTDTHISVANGRGEMDGLGRGKDA